MRCTLFQTLSMPSLTVAEFFGTDENKKFTDTKSLKIFGKKMDQVEI
jgi:hypothetical protein